MLTDGVVVLSPFELDDAATVMQLDADLEIERWFDWPLSPSAEEPATYASRLESARRTVLDKQARWRTGHEVCFIIRSDETGEGLGWVDLQPRGSGTGNVGYGILSRFRRRGVASRSVVLASGYAFDVLGWLRLEIRAHADNVASRAVAEKAGFRLEVVLRGKGVYEKHQPLLGRAFDEAVHCLERPVG